MSLANLVSAPSAIGRYFDVVTLIPASVFVSYLFLLVQAQPWTGTPDWKAALSGVTSLGLGGTAALVVVALFVGLVLHPLQFGMTQLLEGYWGSTPLAQSLMWRRALHHRRRMQDLAISSSDATNALLGVPKGAVVPQSLMWAIVQELESERLLTDYPEDQRDVMPTRLGNVLRRYEAGAGRQYKLPLIGVAPHLAFVAPPGQISAMENQRTDMDLAVRLCWLSMLAALCTVALFWRTGWWMIVALIPYSAAYLFYRGSMIMAAEYGTAMATMLDLNRFRLYESMHLKPVRNTSEEREQNVGLSRLVHWRRADLDLSLPAEQTVAPEQSAPEPGNAD